jgi:tetrahydrodipicolinate N-succinyltransferase
LGNRSCAQIGKTYINGGVGIGGVLEPTSCPVIIEDGALFRCIVVEGMLKRSSSWCQMFV